MPTFGRLIWSSQLKLNFPLRLLAAASLAAASFLAQAADLTVAY